MAAPTGQTHDRTPTAIIVTTPNQHLTRGRRPHMTTPDPGHVPWLRRNTSVWLVTMIVSASVIRSSDEWTAGDALSGRPAFRRAFAPHHRSGTGHVTPPRREQILAKRRNGKQPAGYPVINRSST